MMSLLVAYVTATPCSQKTFSFETPEDPAEAAAATHDTESTPTRGRYPYLLEVVDELAEEGYDYDAELAVGLDVLLDGGEVLRGSWHSA